MVRDSELEDGRDAKKREDDEISVYQIGASLLRHRWSIARWIFAVAIVFGLSTLLGKPSYTSMSSFTPQVSTEGSRSGLASLAGQFGISLGGGDGQGTSPDFYSDLLKSRVILAPIAADTFTVTEEQRKAVTFLDLYQIKAATPERRLDLGVAKLRSLEQTSITTKTGVVQVSVTTQWPSVSLALTQRLVAGVNAFNLRTRQGQASEERQFTETRLQEAKTALRGAEDRLQAFLQSNRQFAGSAELKFQQDRLEREVGLDQQIVTSLSQSYEEVRIREVRNTPVITMVEPPTTPTVPNPRGRGLRILIGLVLGGVVGVILALVGDLSRRSRTDGDPDAVAFFSELQDAKRDMKRVVPGLGKRAD
ncbi:MAG: hypothetical protein ABI442_22355 [Gemmatimonadaceae bacterium]